MFVQKNVKIPKPMWDAAETLIEKGKYASDSELIRAALRMLLEAEGVKIGEKQEGA